MVSRQQQASKEAAERRATDGKMLAFEDPRAKRKPPARTPRGGDDHFGEKADFSASYIKPESDDVSENSFFGKSVKSRGRKNSRDVRINVGEHILRKSTKYAG